MINPTIELLIVYISVNVLDDSVTYNELLLSLLMQHGNQLLIFYLLLYFLIS